jgi:hypothetical protein
MAAITKEDVLAALQGNSPHAMDLVCAWTEQQEKLVATSRDAIILNISRADLYVAAGDREGAIDCLNDALYQARQEGENLLCKQIEERIVDIVMG